MDNQKRKITGRWFRVALIGGVISATGLLCGCEEDAKSSANKQVMQNVSESQRMIRASRQNIHLTNSEIELIGDKTGEGKKLSQNQREKLAEKIVNRMEKGVDFSVFAQHQEEIGKIREKLDQGDKEIIHQYCNILLQASENLISQYEKINSSAHQVNQQRLQRAEQILRKAGQGGERDLRLGPELMLGTLYLSQAHNAEKPLADQELKLHAIQRKLCHLAIQISLEDMKLHQISTKHSSKTIDQLKQRLVKLRQNAADVDKAISTTATRQTELQNQVETNSHKAKNINLQYLALLEKANGNPGPERYKLQQQAYHLRQGDDKQKGGIYYETEQEKLQSRLDAINQHLHYQKMLHQQITHAIDQTAKTIENMEKNPEYTTNLDIALRQSQKRKSQLLSQLGERLDEMKNAESQFNELLTKAVKTYLQAIESYKKASKISSTGNRKYARNLEKTAATDLGLLWRNASGFYNKTAAVLELETMTGIREIQTIVKTLYKEYGNKAVAAENEAIKYLPVEKTEDEAVEKTVEDEAETVENDAETVPTADTPENDNSNVTENSSDGNSGDTRN